MLGDTTMSNKGPSLQDPFLNALRKERVPVSVYLINGIKLQGQVDSFDQFVVVLRNNNISQMVYKHAISTIVPGRPVRFASSGAAATVSVTEYDSEPEMVIETDDMEY